jgi:hypothetical protein
MHVLKHLQSVTRCRVGIITYKMSQTVIERARFKHLNIGIRLQHPILVKTKELEE